MIEFDHQTIIDDLMDAVVVADAGNTIVWMNRAAEDLLGWSRDDLIGSPLTSIQPERMRDRHLSGFRRYLETREPRLMGKPVRVPALRRDGTELDVELMLTSQHTPQGEQVFIGRLRDLRDRLDLERQLDTSRYLAAIVEVGTRLRSQDGPDRVCAIVAEAVVDQLDAAAAAVWLVDAAAEDPMLCGQAPTPAAVRHDGAEEPATHPAEPCPDVVRQVATTASSVWETSSASGGVTGVVPLMMDDAVHGVLVARFAHPVPHDIADVITTFAALVGARLGGARLFAQLRSANQSNAASLAQLDTFFASAPVGLAFLDTQLRYVRLNDTLAAINGEPVEAHLGRTATEILGDIGRSADRLRREVLASGEPLTRGRLSGTTRSDPHRLRHWSVDYYPVRTDAGELLGLGVIVEDMTEQAEAEAALAQQQRFLGVVLDNLRDGIVACDAAGALTVFNRAAREFHALPAEGAIHGGAAARMDTFLPDGTTKMGTGDVPLARALSGEIIKDVEMVIAPHGGDKRVVLCNGQPLYDEDRQKLGAVVAMHDITQRKQAEAKLTHQALHDPLTALPNRLLLLDRMRQALARTDRMPGFPAVLFLDFDRFKVVNDSLGHDVGDRVLTAIAERLRSAVRPADTVARLGGDEFVVLCENIGTEREVVSLCQRLQRAIAGSPLLVADGTEVVMTASIGVAMARHGDERPEDLLRNADAAMYRAKDRGKARHEIYDDHFRAAAVNRLETENALRRAIEDQALELLYQPIVDLDSGRVIGAEALVRHRDPDGGLVSPGLFLDVAEDTGLIVPMGNWIIAEACRQLARWRRSPGAADLRVSINLSARQLADPQLPETLRNAMGREGLPNGAVALEITESVLIEAAGSTLRVLEHLKDVGAKLGIDDFGTGYSSLTYLRRFPVDFLKIDQSFVGGLGADREDTAIVTAVVALAASLDLLSVAEGIESSDQLAMLRDLGCDRGQGYHFARPQHVEAFTSLIASAQTW